MLLCILLLSFLMSTICRASLFQNQKKIDTILYKYDFLLCDNSKLIIYVTSVDSN